MKNRRAKSRRTKPRWGPSTIPWEEKADQGIRGTVADVATILDVPRSWVYANAEKIPGLIRVGKYLRWDLRDVLAWRSNGARRDAGR